MTAAGADTFFTWRFSILHHMFLAMWYTFRRKMEANG